MTRFVLDGPTLLHLVTERLDVHPDHRLVGPHLVRSQALALLLAEVRAGRLDPEEAVGLQDRLTAVRMRLLGDRVSRRTAWDIAVQQGWPTTYDAEYLAVTRLQADALVTVDAAMVERATGLVPIAPVSALGVPAQG